MHLVEMEKGRIERDCGRKELVDGLPNAEGGNLKDW